MQVSTTALLVQRRPLPSLEMIDFPKHGQQQLYPVIMGIADFSDEIGTKVQVHSFQEVLFQQHQAIVHQQQYMHIFAVAVCSLYYLSH